MAGESNIQWTDATWNPVRGCARVSAGCEHCYAERQAVRQSGPGGAYEGLVRSTSRGPTWTGKVRTVPELLDWPLRKRKPLRIFVNSMSDLFHEGVPDEFIAEVFARMALAERHTFQVLTKRPERMMRWCQREAYWWGNKARIERRADYGRPLPNVWLGVSVEDQATADERIPLLLLTPAAVRFVSYEPALGPIWNWRRWLVCGMETWIEGHPESPEPNRPGGTSRRSPSVDWVIVGGESGPGARPCDVQWLRNAVEQCKAEGVACFVKQLGSEPGFKLEDEERRGNPMPSFHHGRGGLFIKKLGDKKGGDQSEWPEELRVREMP